MDFLELAFLAWMGSMFGSQAAVISISVHHQRIGDIPELLYLVTCVLSAIPFVLCFSAKSRGLHWSFEWGICFPLACAHFLGILSVACFSTTAVQEVGEFRHRLRYLVICLTLAFLTLLLNLLGAVVHHSCRAVRLRWRQRPGRPTTNVQLQVSYFPSTTPSNGHGHLRALPLGSLWFILQPQIPLQPFDEEAQESYTAYATFPTHPPADVRPSRNRLNLTIRTDVAAPHATCLILSPLDPGSSEIGSPERGRDIEMKSLVGSIKREADRKFFAESSPKKRVRIGRGRDLA